MTNLHLFLMLFIDAPELFPSNCLVGFMKDDLDAGDEVISGPR